MAWFGHSQDGEVLVAILTPSHFGVPEMAMDMMPLCFGDLETRASVLLLQLAAAAAAAAAAAGPLVPVVIVFNNLHQASTAFIIPLDGQQHPLSKTVQNPNSLYDNPPLTPINHPQQQQQQQQQQRRRRRRRRCLRSMEECGGLWTVAGVAQDCWVLQGLAKSGFMETPFGYNFGFLAPLWSLDGFLVSL